MDLKHTCFLLNMPISFPLSLTDLNSVLSAAEPRETKESFIKRLTLIYSHHVPLPNEHQHHDIFGDPSRGSSDVIEWLVLPVDSLQLCPLQRKSSCSPDVIMAIRLFLPGSGVQPTSISLLSYGAWMAHLVQNPNRRSSDTSSKCQGLISQRIPVRLFRIRGLLDRETQCVPSVHVEPQSSAVLATSLSSHTTK